MDGMIADRNPGKARVPEWEKAHETRVPPRLNALKSRFHDVQPCAAVVAGTAWISQVTQVAGRSATGIATCGKPGVLIHGKWIMGTNRTERTARDQRVHELRALSA